LIGSHSPPSDRLLRSFTLAGLAGQALSFAVTSTGGHYIQFLNVAPAWWQFGQTFKTYQNFDY
jgi:hypothetical protein